MKTSSFWHTSILVQQNSICLQTKANLHTSYRLLMRLYPYVMNNTIPITLFSPLRIPIVTSLRRVLRQKLVPF